MQLLEIPRSRTIFTKYLESFPKLAKAWISFADFEAALQENERARSLYQLAIEQQELDMPESVWKAFIDFEISQSEHDKVRSLYA